PVESSLSVYRLLPSAYSFYPDSGLLRRCVGRLREVARQVLQGVLGGRLFRLFFAFAGPLSDHQLTDNGMRRKGLVVLLAGLANDTVDRGLAGLRLGALLKG